MAKIVSTKFGDRRLVYLPPISLKRNKTANVETIERDRQVPERHRDTSAASVVPKEYAYGDNKRNAWLGGPGRSTIEGNIVSEYPRAVGDQIFQQLFQQASTDTMANYNQGQYPVLPHIGEAPQQMQYTNYGMHNTTQQAPQPGPTPQQPLQQSGPQQEKHIYYGPNGEVLPGPPHCQRGCPEIPQDFSFEGMLHFGRLRAINNIENTSGFPKLPDYLIKDLSDKYGQYEQTVVRVVCRLGRCYVHATPVIRQNPQMSMRPEYFPVYLNEDEEFDYDKFIADYGKGYNLRPYQPSSFYGRNKQQWAPPSPRKFVPRRMDSFRPHTYDNADNFRWRKDDDRIGSRGFNRNFSRQSSPSRAEISEFRHVRGRRRLETRDDIRPIRQLDSRLR